MKYLILSIVIVTIASCSKPKIKPSTVFTQIEFENPYTLGYPMNTAVATAIRVIKDSIYLEDEKAVHKPDTVYYIGNTDYAYDPKDSAHAVRLKSRVDRTKDSVSTTYWPVPSQYVLKDFNHIHPMNPPRLPQQ